MTKRRVSDLSYGHLGEATYDSGEKAWSFTRDLKSSRIIQPVQSLTKHALTSPLYSGQTEQGLTSTQQRSGESWLKRRTGGGHAVKGVLKQFSTAAARCGPSPSTLLAVGTASDTNHSSSSRSFTILALPHGTTGNVLRVVRPHVGFLGWEGNRTLRLKISDLSSYEDTFWVGPGGAIQQVVFATNTEGFTTFLAVRKPESITIFRPTSHRTPVPAIVAPGLNSDYPASRLDTNPIVSLEIKDTGSRPYADVTFNPWYTRQFAVIDECGQWSLWDIEGQQGKRKTFKIVPGTSGHMLNLGAASDGEQLSSNVVEADGWARAIWVADVSTILFCNRKHIMIFGLDGSFPTQLVAPDLMKPTSSDWIMDIERSPIALDEVVILTSSRVFWIKVVPGSNSTAVSSIILSQRHYRDADDTNCKIELTIDDHSLVVFVYSSQSLLVNTIRFSHEEFSPTPMSLMDTFLLTNGNDIHHEASTGMQTISVLSAQFLRNSRNEPTGPGQRCIEKNIEFFQMIGLDTSYTLSDGLLATSTDVMSRTNSSPPFHQHLEVPTVKIKRPVQVLSGTKVTDDFLVTDDVAEGELLAAKPIVRRSLYGRGKRIYADHLNAQLFVGLARPTVARNGKAPATQESMPTYLENVVIDVEERTKSGIQGTTTALDVAGYVSFAEDIDEAAKTLHRTLKDLTAYEDPESALLLAVSTISFLDTGLSQKDRVTTIPNLSNIYDKMMQYWVTCLPAETFGSARLAKERMVRSAAVELSLSSILVSVKHKPAIEPSSANPVEAQTPVRTSSQPLYVRQDSQPSTYGDEFASPGPSQPGNYRLPTPAATETQSSAGGSTIASILSKTDTSTRLRDFAISIKSQPPPGPAQINLLSHWEVSTDPWKYDWEATQRAITGAQDIDSDDEEALAQRKEEHRRRRRAEKYLKRQRQSNGVSSQPFVGTPSFGTLPIHTANARSQPAIAGWDVAASQPASRLLFSSPAKADMSMSQPTGGLFGGKLGKESATKRRRTKGF